MHIRRDPSTITPPKPCFSFREYHPDEHCGDRNGPLRKLSILQATPFSLLATVAQFPEDSMGRPFNSNRHVA